MILAGHTSRKRTEDRSFACLRLLSGPYVWGLSE